jgi:hypothetical protein
MRSTAPEDRSHENNLSGVGPACAGLIGSVYNPGGTATVGPPAAQQKTKAILKKLTQGPVYESLSELCSAVEKDGHCTVFPRYSPLTAVIAFVLPDSPAAAV